MATAVRSGVTLELTADEADALQVLLGNSCQTERIDAADYSEREDRLVVGIYQALKGECG
jgi:hypothetical protein